MHPLAVHPPSSIQALGVHRKGPYAPRKHLSLSWGVGGGERGEGETEEAVTLKPSSFPPHIPTKHGVFREPDPAPGTVGTRVDPPPTHCGLLPVANLRPKSVSEVGGAWDGGRQAALVPVSSGGKFTWFRCGLPYRRGPPRQPVPLPHVPCLPLTVP